MFLRDLDAKREDFDDEAWADNVALYKGGKEFRARINRFLPQRPQEPNPVWEARKKEACYRPYVGAIVDYYVAWLFSAVFDVRSKDAKTCKPKDEIDPFYAKWKEDVGNDCDLTEFVREAFKDALVNQTSYWVVEFPNDGLAPPEDKAEYDNRGLGHGKLCRVGPEQVYDFELDDDGDYAWVIIHDVKKVRPNPKLGPRALNVETWKLYDATTVETFVLEYVDGKRPPAETPIEGDGGRPHGAKQVPLIPMTMPEGLCIVERVKEAQQANFRIGSALDWNIKTTCYSMPVFNLTDDESAPRMGAGYYIMIGLQEKFSWASPPTDHLNVTATEKDSSRQEIYRLTHQMALSVNNQSAAVVKQSGESKEQDSLSTRVMLNSFGAIVKKALEMTFEILSDGRGDEDLTFSIEGLDAFDTESVAVLLANTVLADELNVPSLTFRKELFTRAALGMVPDADQGVKNAIREEIVKGVEEQGIPDPAAEALAQAHAVAKGMTNAPAGKEQGGNRKAGGAKPGSAASGGNGRANASSGST